MCFMCVVGCVYVSLYLCIYICIYKVCSISGVVITAHLLEHDITMLPLRCD